jgi:hypothetical protein
MRGLPLEPAARLCRALFTTQDKQFGWRLASVTISLVSVVLIALTLGYRVSGAELPPALLVDLLATFTIVCCCFPSSCFGPRRKKTSLRALSLLLNANSNRYFKMRSTPFSLLTTRQSAAKRIQQPRAFSERDDRNSLASLSTGFIRIPTNSIK